MVLGEQAAATARMDPRAMLASRFLNNPYGLADLVRLCGGRSVYQATHWEHELLLDGRRQREVRCDECCCST